MIPEKLPSRIVEFPKTVVLTALACLYLSAFILSPYWKLPEALWAQIGLLCVLLLAGSAWAFASAGRLSIRIRPREFGGCAALLGLLFLLNLPMLTSGIPWRGDEDLHIVRTLGFVQRMPLSLLALLLLLGLLAIASAARDLRLAAVAVLGFGILAILVGLHSPIFGGRPLDWMVRYPLINYWLFMLIPAVAQRLVGPYHEILFRLVPFLALAATCWLFQRELAWRSFLGRLLWGVIAFTIPVVIYYGSILYIEPLAVVLMTLVCLRARGLLLDDPDELRARSEWYALIGIGFVKETTAAFLICFAVCRLAIRIRRRWLAEKALAAGAREQPALRSRWRWLLEEGAVLCGALLPLLMFVVLRAGFADVRHLRPDVTGLLDPSVYRAAAQSLWDQFGAFMVFFLAGLTIAFRRREAALAAFLSFAVLTVPAALLVDNGGIYAGLSRFNLLILPPILAGAVIALRALSRSRALLPMAAAAALASNLLLTPINFDGTKKPLWGTYLVDTSEHYYPYREALVWLKQHGTGGRLLIADLDYHYLFDFYFRQLDWQPRHRILPADIPIVPGGEFGMYFDGAHWAPQRAFLGQPGEPSGWNESAALARALDYATTGGFRTVFFQVIGPSLPDTPPTGAFRLAKTIENDAHALLIFSRPP